jgi:hypothetical protein
MLSAAVHGSLVCVSLVFCAIIHVHSKHGFSMEQDIIPSAVLQVMCCCAGDEVVAGSAEVQEVLPYVDLDISKQPRQFVTGISKKKADGALEELIKARTTWV